MRIVLEKRCTYASTITISSTVVTKRDRMADLLNVRRFNYSKRHDGPLHVWPYTSKNQTFGPHRCEELDCRSLTVPIGWILWCGSLREHYFLTVAKLGGRTLPGASFSCRRVSGAAPGVDTPLGVRNVYISVSKVVYRCRRATRTDFSRSPTQHSGACHGNHLPKTVISSMWQNPWGSEKNNSTGKEF